MSDDRVRPVGAIAHPRSIETTLEAETIWGGLDQGHHAILIAEDDMTIGIDHGCRTAARGIPFRTPGELAGLEIDTERRSLVMAMAAIKVIANQHHAPMVILQLLAAEKIELLGRDPSLTVGNQL